MIEILQPNHPFAPSHPRSKAHKPSPQMHHLYNLTLRTEPCVCMCTHALKSSSVCIRTHPLNKAKTVYEPEIYYLTVMLKICKNRTNRWETLKNWSFYIQKQESKTTKVASARNANALNLMRTHGLLPGLVMLALSFSDPSNQFNLQVLNVHVCYSLF